MFPFAKYTGWVSVLMMVNGFHGKQVSETVITPERHKWAQAESICSRRGQACQLAVGEGEGSTRWDTLEITENERYWVGGKKQRELHWKESGRPFFEDYGCYNESSRLDQPQTITSNNPVECFQYCNTPFVGLQQAKCFCLMSMTGLRKVNAQLCDVKCPDPSTRRCGGITEVSFFKFPNRIGFTKKGSGESFYWTVGRDRFLISNAAFGETGRFCVSATQKYQVAETSLCPSGSKDLALEDDDMDKLFQEVSGVKKDYDSYWTPLSSKQGTLWLNDLPVKNESGTGGCVAVSRTQGEIKLYLDKCSNDHYGICTCHKEDSLTSEETPTNSAFTTLLMLTGTTTPTVEGMSTSTKLTPTVCPDHGGTNGNASSHGIWSCTEAGPAAGSKRGEKSENPRGHSTAIIAAAAGGGTVLIVGVAIIIAVRIRRGNLLIHRDKYGRVHYPI